MVCPLRTMHTTVKYFFLFVMSALVTSIYYTFSTYYGVSLDEPGEFAFFVTVTMVLVAITLLFFIWWLNAYITCNLTPDSNNLFKDEIDYLIKSYYILAATTAVAITSFLYSQFRYRANSHIRSFSGFDLPGAAYGGKRKGSTHRKK